jgi:Fe-S-cluster containining protein
MVNCCLESKCIRCCIETNMVLSYRDIENIQKMGYDRQFFVSENKGWLQLKNHQGHCVFHDGTRCNIYYHRPEGCTLYPVVYDKDSNGAILDNECPQKHCFSLSKAKSRKLDLLISILEKERTERTQSKNDKNRKKRKKL